MTEGFNFQAGEDQGEQAVDQMRGRGVSEQQRYRITLEVCSVVEGYFGPPDVAPVARVRPSSLVLIGAHGCLDNIDDDGNFIRDEAFIWRGKEVLRKAGTSARGLLAAWVKLRISLNKFCCEVS